MYFDIETQPIEKYDLINDLKIKNKKVVEDCKQYINTKKMKLLRNTKQQNHNIWKIQFYVLIANQIKLDHLKNFILNQIKINHHIVNFLIG